MRSNQMALDYSQSPFQPPAQFVKALARSLASLNSYPDPSYRLLKERLAKKHGVLPSNISLGNGADELIDLITVAFGNQILIPTPTFGQYEIAVFFDERNHSFIGKIRICFINHYQCP